MGSVKCNVRGTKGQRKYQRASAQPGYESSTGLDIIPMPFHKVAPEEIDLVKQLLLAALVVASEEMIKGAPL